MACGLTHQRCDEFMKNAYPRVSPHKRGRMRTYLFQGLNKFHMRNIMDGVRLVLFVSVVLFSCGVSDYLYSLYPRVGLYAWSYVTAGVAVYVALTILPLIFGNCPYQTALTAPLRSCGTLLLFSGHAVWRRLLLSKAGTSSRHKARHFDRVHFLVEKANARAANLDPVAMEWLFTDNDFSDTDMDKFLEGLPGYVHSRITVKEALPKVLTAPYILKRIRKHLLTCVTATELSEEERIKRVLACVESLQVILHLRTNDEGLTNLGEEESLQYYVQSFVDHLNTSCGKPEEKRDLRAFCVRALAFQSSLTKCLEPSLERARKGSPDVKVPDYFMPLYTFFKQQQPLGEVSDETEPPDEDTKRRRVLLHDGPLLNLTLLAKAILLHDDVVAPSSLSMCWKTLDILRREFRITGAKVSNSSLRLFNDIHNKTRLRVRAEEPGFSVIPLLEILDIVDGGRRLSIVFQDHPNAMYHRKDDLVFGKDHLRNPDLFRAFANCLPHFLTRHPEKFTHLMEGLVHRDHVWTSLQVHLSTSLRGNNPVPVMLRAFETCCTVIDVAFVALENSDVDWRAPDFGSLAHYFELFVTDCFQGMFIERAIGFRVGLIKARFCRAVLAQFLDEFDREGTVIFRSHWDVASLARVFYSLSVGDDSDVKFWKSFVDGGSIGPEFMANTHRILCTARRDGPLLNFCRLGHLGLMAVPFKGSSLTDTDFRKLLDLMQKIKDDLSQPLTDASISVWEELRRLHDEVVCTCERRNKENQVLAIADESSKVDKVNLDALLEKISIAYGQRPSDHVQAQASGNSAVVQLKPQFGVLMPGYDRTTLPAVIDDRCNSLPAQVLDSSSTV